MAFEDDMIEAGYSDEQEYLDGLLDDFEEKYTRQRGREMEYPEDFDFSYDEKKEHERIEKLHKRESEKQWVEDWKESHPDLAIIWEARYNTLSYYADIANLDNRRFMGLNEHNELKKWLKERQHFESERQKEEWKEYLKELFMLYKNELFNFYFPEDDQQINMSLISQQASELSSIISNEPLLWESICSNYVVAPKLFDNIEKEAFWEEVYKRDMDYEYWKDNNPEQYDQIAKQWIADSAVYVYGEWMTKHETEALKWKNANHELIDKYKRNYEIRERNKLIDSIVNKHESKSSKRHSFFGDLDSFWEEECFVGEISNPFLPDLENTEEVPCDISDLSKEQQDSIASLDMSNISKDSSKYADKVLNQLWLYVNRDEWEMDEVKKRHDYLFRFWKKYSKDLLLWWKNKYPTKWNDFLKTAFPIFKNNFESVMKFRLWALDDHKDEFIELGDKYLPYWKKTIKLMYGQDIHKQICSYFYKEIGHSTDFWGEDVAYIKKHTSTSEGVEIWQKELRDKVLWDIIYNEDYQEHYLIESIFTSLV